MSSKYFSCRKHWGCDLLNLMLVTLRNKIKYLSLDLHHVSSKSTLELLVWLESLSQILSRKQDPPKINRNILFMAHEFKHSLQNEGGKKKSSNPSLRLEKLSSYLFQKKGFRAFHQKNISDEKDILLPYIMKNKMGDSRIISLIYKSLAEHLGLSLDLILLPKTCVLKLPLESSSFYVDICNEGEIFTSVDLLYKLNEIDELSDSLNNLYLEPIQVQRLIYLLLERLKYFYASSTLCDKHLLILDLLIHQQIAKIQALGERALLLANMGFIQEALSDFKRYFSFNELDCSPSEIVRTFKGLLALEGKNKRNLFQV